MPASRITAWPAALAATSFCGLAAADEIRCPPQQPVEPGRRSPGVPVLRFEPTPCDPGRLPDADPNELDEFPELPDRWRIVQLLGYQENLLDPYHGNNWLKGDRPAFGEDWFFSLGVVSDSVIEPRRFPVPVAVADSGDPGSLDTISNSPLPSLRNTALERLFGVVMVFPISHSLSTFRSL